MELLALVIVGFFVVSIVGMVLGVKVRGRIGPGGFTIETGDRDEPPARKK